MNREITEYDNYKLELPYLDKELTEEENERKKLMEEAREKSRAIVQELP